MTILLCDPRVRAVPVRECGEPLVPVPTRLGGQTADPRGDQPTVLVRRGLADRLLGAAEQLPRGLRLRVSEGHRSPGDQRRIIETYRAQVAAAHPQVQGPGLDTLTARFVAPLEVAPHVAGAAVDLTLTDARGRDLDLGTPIDATPEASGGRCYTAAAGLPAAARRNRALLAELLTWSGLVNYPTEWWHWSYGDRYWALLTGAEAAPYGPTVANRPTLTVDLDAVATNVRHFVTTTPAVIAVVKADAFGHGLAEVARTALDAGAAGLGVTSVTEALALRDSLAASGPRARQARVVSWLNPVDADWSEALRADVEVAVPSIPHLRAVTQAAAHLGVPARVHLHLDCGMARDGAAPQDWAPLCAAAAAAEVAGLAEVVGVMGHLPCAETPEDPANATGRERFADGVAVARRHGLAPRLLHLAATAAALLDPASHHTACRVGAGLFGIDPRPDGPERTAGPLLPALRLTAPVVALRDVPVGAGVGYGHLWRASRPTRLATIPVGYADGLPRAAGERAEVSVHGRRCPVVGRISMDQTVIDVGALPVALGDEVTIWGGEGPSVAEWATWSSTLAHEICTGVGGRVLRVIRPALSTVGTSR